MIEKLKLNSKAAYIATISFLLITAVLEILAYKSGGVFSIVASRIWFVQGIVLLVSFLVFSIWKLVIDIKEKRFLLILFFAALIAILTVCIGNISVSDTNPDSCIQLADGLNAFKLPDWNYTGKGFLGYQNRQYMIAAIPTLLFGRNEFSLHLGFGFPFIAGVILLFIEMRIWCIEHFKTNEFLALIPAGSLLIFPFITEYYRNFEQAFTPVAFTLIAVGLYMRFVRKPDIVTLLALSWTGAFLADSYTPGLASWALVICFLLLNITPYWRKQVPLSREENHKVLFMIMQITAVVHIAVFFVATFVIGRGDRISSVGEGVTLKDTIRSSIEEFINDRNVRFLGFFAGAFIIYLMFSFLGQLRFYDFIASGWMMGVVIISRYLRGYTDYGYEHLAQRFMIIIPVFVVTGFLAVLRIISKHKIAVRKRTIAILFAFSLLCGIYNLSQRHYSFKYFGNVVPMKYLLPEIRNTLKLNGMNSEDNFNIVVYTNNNLMTNIADYSKYYFPNAKCITLGADDNGTVPDFENDNNVTLLISEKQYPENVINDTDIYYVISTKDRMYDLNVEWHEITRITR